MRNCGCDVMAARSCAFGMAPKYDMARVLKLGILLGCDGCGCDTHAPIYTRHHILQFIKVNVEMAFAVGVGIPHTFISILWYY